MITEADIRRAVAALGLSRRAVCLHSSLRSLGRIEDGAKAVLTGFLAEECTLLVPTFSDDFAVPPPSNQHFRRNGWDYDRYAGPIQGINRVYNPESNEMTLEEMGVIPATVLSQPERRRGNHPLNSFTALGGEADHLVGSQTPSDVFAPLRALCEVGGWVVLMGVGLDKMTLIHAAEETAGRRPFIRWANNKTGAPMAVRVGGCSKGFENFRSALSSLSKSFQVGASNWEAYPAAATLQAAAEIIRNDPKITHCGNPQCERCRDAIDGGPIMD